MPRTKKRPANNPDTLVRAFVDRNLPDIGNMIAGSGNNWTHLLKAFGLDKDPGAMEEHLYHALPSDELRRAFAQYSDARTEVEACTQEAAFAVGLELARRFSGGAR